MAPSMVPALRTACVGNRKQTGEMPPLPPFPSLGRKVLVLLIVQRSIVADEVVKPMEGLPNSSAMSSPHSTNPLRSREVGWNTPRPIFHLPLPSALAF